MSKYVLKKELAEDLDNTIPLFPIQLYDNPAKYEIEPNEVYPEIFDAKSLVSNYINQIDNNWNSCLNKDESKLRFYGGLPIASGENGNYFFKKSAFITLVLFQTEFKFNQSKWVTEEQVQKFKLNLKEKAHPVLLLWKKIISQNEYKLVFTKFYNIEDIYKSTSLDKYTFVPNINNFDYRLTELCDEYGINCIYKTIYISENGFILRNESFLFGSDEKYSLLIPEQHMNTQDIVAQQQYLIALTIVMFRTHSHSKIKNIELANNIGYFLGVILVNEFFPTMEYQGSILYKKKFNLHSLQAIYFTDDLLSFMKKNIFEINTYFSEFLSSENSFYSWLISEYEHMKLQKVISVSEQGQLNNKEILNCIRRNNFDIDTCFDQDLSLKLNQEAIRILDELPEYRRELKTQLQRIITERDIKKYPNEYEFYTLIIDSLLNNIIEQFKILENVKLFWTEFEKKIINSDLPEPQKDSIIKKKAEQYKKFIKEILFKKIDSNFIYEECNNILKI